MAVRNDSISVVSYTTAIANATIIDPGEGIEQHGHCWSTNAESITIDTENKTEKGAVNSAGSYSSNLANLTPGASYYVKAYIKNGKTVIYGNDVLPFTTLSMGQPVVTTGTVTNITTSSATVSANLNSLGEGASLVTQHGHCWSSETTTPVIEDNENKTSFGSISTTGIFESELAVLSDGTLYHVRAYATNDAGTDYGEAISFTTIEQLRAEFDANPRSGDKPLSVQFTDLSTGDINSWSWNFGDGKTSTSQNPLHVYNDQGVYSVTLTVSDDYGSDSETKTNYITVLTGGTAPVAAFTADKTLIFEGETVYFTDQSKNNPTSWAWTFGDGGTSSSPIPAHRYNTEGIYTVTLTVTNDYGSDTKTINNYITVEVELTGTVSDSEGNIYQTVKIGNQWWMAENLKSTKYNNDGSAIPLITDNTAWGDLTTPAYCWYNNDEATYKNPYGAIYNWYTVNTGNLCPTGWHVPTDAEWITLTTYLGGEDVAGGKLKSTTHWLSPNTGATNETGFAALPGGHRYVTGTFDYVGTIGFWWSATADEFAFYRVMRYDNSVAYRWSTNFKYGHSVRCIKD